MARRILAPLVLAALLAACGPDAPVSDVPGASQPPSGPPADGRLTIGDDVAGPAVEVTDALAAEGPVRVAGSLFVAADGRVLLCSAIAESFPPQCGGDRLEVVGFDPDAFELEEANGVRWAEGAELSGTVDAG